jgi:toxin ParE1/3/4
MNSYRLLKAAEKDMEDLWFYLSQRNGIAADRLVAKLFNRFPMLAQFPAMGKSRDELSVGLRSFPVKPYVVFYMERPNGIEITRIIHQSRDLEDIFP